MFRSRWLGIFIIMLLLMTYIGGQAGLSVYAVVAVPVTGITLDHSSATLEVGEYKQLSATITPNDATNKLVHWRSDNVSVATVSPDGKIHAKGPGNTTIWAKTDDGHKQASCEITVTGSDANPVTGISIVEEDFTLEYNTYKYLTYSLTPADGTPVGLTWYSGNTNVATVGSDGKVWAKGGGETTISVKVKDQSGNYTIKDSVTVTVPSPGPVIDISMKKSSVSIVNGGWHYVEYTLTPAGGSHKGITWRSDNPAIAEVRHDGKVFAKGVGTTKVYAKIKFDTDTYKEVSCTITVTSSETKPVTGVSLSHSSVSLKVGDYISLSATIAPKDATNKGVYWWSDNPKIATVSDKGKITALATGKTTVWVKTLDGHKKASCSVNITAKDTTPKPDPAIPVTGVTLSHSDLSLAPGEHFALTATILPSDASNKTLTWTSDQTSIAKVDGNGKVTALIPGSATITVTSKDGNFTATCEVTVSAPLPEEIAFKYTNITLKTGDSKKLPLVVAPSGAWALYTWQSSNLEVVSVDHEGKITALAPGEAEITVSTGSLSATCIITVVDPEGNKEVKYQLEKSKNSLSIPKAVLEEKQELDIRHGKMKIIIPTNAWLAALSQLGLGDSQSVLVEVEEFEPELDGKMMAIGPAYSFHLRVEEIRVSTFSDQLLLTISYDPSLVKDPEKLALYWYNPETGTWDKLPSLVDPENHSVSALITHWSSFALLQPVSQTNSGWLYVLLTAVGLNAVLILAWVLRRR